MVGATGLFGPGRASPFGAALRALTRLRTSARIATSCRLKTRAVLSSPPGVILPVVTLAQGHRGAPNDSYRRILGRGDRIRTCDIYVPNVALYQSELRPVPQRLSLAQSRGSLLNYEAGPTALNPSTGTGLALTLATNCSNSRRGIARLCRNPCDSSQPARAR